jgi:hypothetical protein
LVQNVDKWKAQGLVEKPLTQDTPSASGGLKLPLTRPSFVPGTETRETATTLDGNVFASLRCLMVNCGVAPFLFAILSPKSIVNKASIHSKLLKRRTLVFQIIADKKLLNPRSMEQWSQFVERLPSLPEGAIFQSFRSQCHPSVLL